MPLSALTSMSWWRARRLALRFVVGSAAILFVLASCLMGTLAITVAVRSAHQLTVLEKSTLVPTVGLGMLSQNLDQERALIDSDLRHMKPDNVRAAFDELHGLDLSIQTTAQTALRQPTIPLFMADWAQFLAVRTSYLDAVRSPTPAHASPKVIALEQATLSRRSLHMSNRLNTVLDLVQSDAGVQLYNGENLYTASIAMDWQAIRFVIISFLLVVLLGVAIAITLIRRLTRDLGALTETARAITQGAWDTRAAVQGSDEIATVATAFNHMADAILSAEQRADSDALTGLPNHRALIAAIDQELERSQRYARTCAILFLDLDHFKALNDSYGHPAGDAVLREFAVISRAALRTVDILGRWGGEEFAVILPEADIEMALGAAERVRAAVAAHAFAQGGGIHLTCSIGVATYPADAPGRDGLIALVDQALYAAKRMGRNQVRAIGDPAVAALAIQEQEAGSREETALAGTVDALAQLVEVRDHYTGEHTAEVAALAMRLAGSLGLSTVDARMVGLAARLHDIGKIAVPDAILGKPGLLTTEERAVLFTYPEVGADVISRVPGLRVVAPLIRAHQERWDGTGYPAGLSGTAIPLGARIIGVADAYAAMITDRPYHSARSIAQALAEVQRCSGTQFDPSVVAILPLALSTGAADHSVSAAAGRSIHGGAGVSTV